MATLKKGTLFPSDLVSDMFSKVTGHSALAKLSGQTPVSFVGNQIFTFSMDKEVDIVAESGRKSEGGVTVAPVTIQPVKIEYGARVTDEFMYASEEKQIDLLANFADGYAKKVARALDIMAIKGNNPRTGQASALIPSTNVIAGGDAASVGVTTTIDAAISDAVAALGDNENTGFIFSKTGAAKMGALKENGVRQYPEFALGGKPEVLAGVPVDVTTVMEPWLALVGDFANAFKWGYAKEIPLEVIQYGSPDGGDDLKRTNEVYLRAETYLGWAVLNQEAFVLVTAD